MNSSGRVVIFVERDRDAELGTGSALVSWNAYNFADFDLWVLMRALRKRALSSETPATNLLFAQKKCRVQFIAVPTRNQPCLQSFVVD